MVVYMYSLVARWAQLSCKHCEGDGSNPAPATKNHRGNNVVLVKEVHRTRDGAAW